jgi:hypothetical protein
MGASKVAVLSIKAPLCVRRVLLPVIVEPAPEATPAAATVARRNGLREGGRSTTVSSIGEEARALRNSAHEAKRCSGSFERAFSTACEAEGGNSGRM